jgi:uncharacterized protein YfbU (UPF0304 family)
MGRINSRVDLALKVASEILASTKNSVLKVQLIKVILDFDQRQQERTNENRSARRKRAQSQPFNEAQAKITELTNELDALRASTSREILALKSRLGVVETTITQLQDDVSIAKKEAMAARNQTTEMAKKLTFVNGMIMRCGQLLTQEEREKYGSDLFEEFKSSDGLLSEFFKLLGLDLSKWRKWESQYGEDSLAMVKAFEDTIQNGVGMLSLLRLKLRKIGIDVDAINAARDYRDFKINLAELKQRASSHIRFETADSSPKILSVRLPKELLPRLTQDALREAVRKLKNDPAKKLQWLEIAAELLLADSDVAPLLIKETIAVRYSP